MPKTITLDVEAICSRLAELEVTCDGTSEFRVTRGPDNTYLLTLSIYHAKGRVSAQIALRKEQTLIERAIYFRRAMSELAWGLR